MFKRLSGLLVVIFWGCPHLSTTFTCSISVCMAQVYMQWYVGAWISLATFFKQAWIISHVKVAAHEIVATTIDHEILGSSSAGPNCKATRMGTALLDVDQKSTTLKNILSKTMCKSLCLSCVGMIEEISHFSSVLTKSANWLPDYLIVYTLSMIREYHQSLDT